MYTKKQELNKLKQYKLARQLFEDLKSKTINSNFKNIPIKFEIPDDRQKIRKGSHFTFTYNYVTDKSKDFIIEFNLKDAIHKRGYKNDYYKGRARFINKYILHNRHNSIRFTLLHELGHFYCYKHKGLKVFNNKGLSEKLADRFAIRHLKRSI